MKQRLTKLTPCLYAAFVFSCCWMNASPVFGGLLRINLINGTSLEVPYYWEEKGEIKFEMPGGVAGIPKAYVRSVQEIVTTREFDPEVLVESTSESSTNDRKDLLLELAEKQTPSPPAFEKIGPEASLALLGALGARSASVPAERIHGPMFSSQGNFTELVRLKGNGLMLVMQNILTSREELKDRRFSLTLYDSEGHVLQRQPCDVYKLEVDSKTMKKLSLRGHLFSVIANIKPDSRISRYEISVSR